jgi:hypothetical protein
MTIHDGVLAGHDVDRRSVLRIGSLGMGGLTLSNLLRLEAQAGTNSSAKRRATSVIVIHMRGGPSQLDTWDMKPNAPVEIRGEFDPISTSVPDLQICELLPMSAAIMHKWSIVRSLRHPPQYGDVSHSRGDQVVFTGHAPGRDDNTNIHPSMGSVAARQLQSRDRSMPAYVMIPRRIPGTARRFGNRLSPSRRRHSRRLPRPRRPTDPSAAVRKADCRTVLR